MNVILGTKGEDMALTFIVLKRNASKNVGIVLTLRRLAPTRLVSMENGI